MARVIRTATVDGLLTPAFGAAAEPTTELTAQAALLATAVTDAGLVVTADTATLAAIDAYAAAVIAITGDTYVAHQFVFGGATGLTHAQVATTGALLNTAIADFLTGQTAAVTAQTAVTAVSLTTALAAVAADVTLLVNLAMVTTKNKLDAAVKGLLSLLRDGTSSFAD